MNEQDFDYHKKEATEKWLWIESLNLAYSKSYRRTKLASTALGWGTVAAGTLTSISGLVGTTTVPLPGLLIPVAATITGIIALVKQTFVSEGVSADLWELQMKLQPEKDKITSYLRSLASSGDEKIDKNFYDQLNGRVKAWVSKHETSISNMIKEQAKKSLIQNRISKIKFGQLATDDGDDAEITLPVGQEIEGVTPLRRGN